MSIKLRRAWLMTVETMKLIMSIASRNVSEPPLAVMGLLQKMRDLPLLPGWHWEYYYLYLGVGPHFL